MRKALYNPGLAHTRLANQNQIDLPALQQNLGDFQHLIPPTNQGRQGSVRRQL
ncbi:MAG: hypothetical protein NTW21_38550 [Verrucomicrobia bacterium]|nr:hypothetical protein [Verrucomicrobiota bacterium]